MPRKNIGILLVIAALILVSLSCSFSVSTASIKNAVMAADPDGEQPTTSFAPDMPFYCIVELANAPEDTVLKAVWIAQDVEDTDPGFEINTTEITTGLPFVTFDLTLDYLWPTGTYQVDLYLDGDFDQSLDFEVR